MKKGILGFALILIMMSLMACNARVGYNDSSEPDYADTIDTEQVSGFQEIPAIDYADYEEYKAQEEKELAAKQAEYKKLERLTEYPSSVDSSILEELNGSITFETSTESSKKYTIHYDEKVFGYLGESNELWGHGDAYLFGKDASDTDNVIVASYISPEDYKWFLDSVEMKGLRSTIIEARDDALMYIYEGYYEGEYYGEVFYLVETEGVAEGVHFSNITQEYLANYGLWDVYSLPALFGELKISE